MTQAEAALNFVIELVEGRQLCDRFSEIECVDCDATSNDLLHIVFEDQSVLLVDQATQSVRVS